MSAILLALLFMIAVVGSCTRKPKSPIDPNAYAKEIGQGHQERWKELSSESGWLTLSDSFG